MTAQAFTAFVINLDRDTERLRHMQSQLQRAGIAFTRQPGFHGDALPDTLKPFFFHPSGEPRTGMKRGEIGCYASHLHLLSQVASGACGDLALIMEDDLTIAPDLIAVIEQARAALPPGWDILRLSNPPRRAYAPVAPLGGARIVARYSKIPNSAGAYLVTPAGARKFLHNGVRGLSFDDDLRRPWFHGMETFGIVPPPVEAGFFSQSSIDAIEAGRFDKGVSSRMERLLRGDHFYALQRLSYNKRTLGVVNWLACSVINLAEMLAVFFHAHSVIHRAARLFPAGRRRA